MKKRVSNKKDKGSALTGAIKDLEAEIKKLGKEKSSLKQELNEVSSAIEVDHDREKELQRKMAQLIEKEAKLNDKRKHLQMNIDDVSDKITKISKIKSEMSDIN